MQMRDPIAADIERFVTMVLFLLIMIVLVSIFAVAIHGAPCLSPGAPN